MSFLFSLSSEAAQTFGYVGSVLTSITFIPQVYKSWKSKSVGDLSIAMMLIVILGNIVWIIYALGINNGEPIIVTNAIVMLLSLLLIFFKLTFKK